MLDPVRVERRGPIVEVTLDRPPVNAIDAATSRAIGDAFMAFRDDPSLLVAILTAAGKLFSAGWDLKAAALGDEGEGADYGPGGFAGLTRLFDLDKPVIAAVNGHAIAGGFELTLAADLMVAAEHAEFWLPETTVGVVPDAGGVQRLPRILPRRIAMEMLLTGRRMSAVEAKHHGLVNAVVPAGEVLPTARKLAEAIVKGAPLCVRAITEVVRGTEDMSVEQAFRALDRREFPIHAAAFRSEDRKEGPRAFVEKRAPVWSGR
ncbi:MAG: enoyl-CoA hydratase-related protein [Alphaproteobacteria bacterium]